MGICEVCHCIGDTFMVAGSELKMCDPCSEHFLRMQKAVKKSVTRVYNDTKFFIRQKYGTIKAWSIGHNFNPGVVNAILNRTGAYPQTDEDNYTDMHVRVFIAMIRSGMGDHLVSDGYITEDWL